MTVLLADDELQSRTGLRDGLDWKALGFDQVLVAENGLRAWQLFELHRPELLISDIRMPGLDGLELVARVRQFDRTAQVILISGHSDFTYAKRGIQLGVTDYLLKPFKLHELTALVKAARDGAVKAQFQAALPLWTPGLTSRLAGVQAPMPLLLSPVVARALALVHERLGTELDVESVASVVKKSPNYFSHLFKKEVGVSFSEYVNRARVDVAERQLRETTLLAYEIAAQVGYPDYKYFIQVFRRLKGHTPREHRRS